MKKVHIVLLGLAVLFGVWGVRLLQSTNADAVRVDVNLPGKEQVMSPTDEKKDEQPRTTSRSKITSRQSLDEKEQVVPTPDPQEMTVEDEAILALSQEVLSPVPLGPKFDNELTTPDEETRQAIALHEAVYESPGTLLARGKNTKPIGPMKVKTYRVEEVVLPHPTTIEIDGKPTTVHTALRVTVTGGPFPVGALPVVVWIDDAVLGFGQPSPELYAISAVTLDPSLLREGATIALSYGMEGNRTKLPEKFTFSVHQ